MKKKNNNNGFTLIEILAVIVILGILMLVAIPNISRSIIESRKKTTISTIGNYISAISTNIHDSSYSFEKDDTIYAMPIECIAMEGKKDSPLGKWMQASKDYFAYVLVQYNSKTSAYIYGYTFKDSTGYGLLPTTIDKLSANGKQIKKDTNLSLPITGDITSLTTLENWHNSGFIIDNNPKLVVFESESEGIEGDYIDTCTLFQKADNYTIVEEEKLTRPQKLSKLILLHNPIIKETNGIETANPSTNDTDGLYSSIATDSGNKTYYFRGNIQNNYVDFAENTWRIIRINEDGTVRLLLNSTINNTGYKFTNNSYNSYVNMYYSNSDNVQNIVNNWYKDNIIDKNYDKYISPGIFCEQAKVKSRADLTGGSAEIISIENYVSDFRCTTDANGKGILKNSDGDLVKVGLITFDEVVHAGGNMSANKNYYLYPAGIWTMTPNACDVHGPFEWVIFAGGNMGGARVSGNWYGFLRPVINLNADIRATGQGSKDDPYKINIKKDV